jgi:dipeptidyl aminopeptidase/acylaminoacyl peptidase
VYDRLTDGDGATASGAGAAAATGKERVIVALEKGEGEPIRLYSVALDGSDRRRITPTFEPPAGHVLVEVHPAWSPQAGHIVFTRYVSGPEGTGRPHIWTVHPDGSDLGPLTRGPHADFAPAWSADGTKIAFTRASGERSEIFVMNADGSGMRRVGERDGARHELPAWSPDGRTIAYASTTADDSDLFLMNADGSAARPLTSGPDEDQSPAWSPDGRRLAFIRNGDLWMVDADGSRAVQLTRTAVKEASPQWSRDGERILFARDPGSVLLLHVDDRRLERIPAKLKTFSLTWGPES